ncbi:helix-turn-helix transcriptional regulator [Pseudoalteromonas galatheae]|uniref:helix-turn-helix transcriptional regulator n=1 Tax=Pseudoalteromonas galatheae TaxID=579562 RepID=UPI0030CF4FCB
MTNNNIENTFADILSFKPLIDKAGNLHSPAKIEEWLMEIGTTIRCDSIHLIGFKPLSPTAYQHHVIGPNHLIMEDTLNLDAAYENCKESHTPYAIKVKGSEYGLMVPLRGVSGIVGCVLITSDSYIDSRQQEWHWSILGLHLLQALKRSFSKDKIKITKRERDCILWASEGKTSWEISQILGISERTVNFHLNNCIEKTNSANRQQAIVKYLFNHTL